MLEADEWWPVARILCCLENSNICLITDVYHEVANDVSTTRVLRPLLFYKDSSCMNTMHLFQQNYDVNMMCKANETHSCYSLHLLR